MDAMDFAVNKTYSLKWRHIQIVKFLAKSQARSEAEVLREAIEDLERKYPLDRSDQPPDMVAAGKAGAG